MSGVCVSWCRRSIWLCKYVWWLQGIRCTTPGPNGQPQDGWVQEIMDISYWRLPGSTRPWSWQDMEKITILLALCKGNLLVTGGFPIQRVSNAGLLCFLYTEGEWCIPFMIHLLGIYAIKVRGHWSFGNLCIRDVSAFAKVSAVRGHCKK